MISVKVEKDTNQSDLAHKLIACPECGQKLMDARWVYGESEVRIKCRRCRRYIRVTMKDI